MELFLGAPANVVIIGFIQLVHFTHASLTAQVYEAKDDVIKQRYQSNYLFWDAEDAGVKHCVLTGVAGRRGKRQVTGVDAWGTLPLAPIRVHLFLKGTKKYASEGVLVRALQIACA